MSGGAPFYEAAAARLARARPDLALGADALHAIDLALHQERCAWRADWGRCATRPGPGHTSFETGVDFPPPPREAAHG